MHTYSSTLQIWEEELNNELILLVSDVIISKGENICLDLEGRLFSCLFCKICILSYSIKMWVRCGDLFESTVLPKVWKCARFPKKLAISWRLLLNRLSTKVALVRRGILLAGDSLLCPLCLKESECIDHLSFDCLVINLVWIKVYDWLGVSVVLPSTCRELFRHNSLLAGRKSRKLTYIIWHARLNGLFA